MLRACAVWLALGGPVAAQDITRAELAEPTARYDHAVLGDALEWGALHLWLEGGERRTIRLPETRVFEDVQTRLADLDGDGTREVVVVEADLSRGASLAIYDAQGLRAATRFIGERHRWLAPAAIGDLDGDGRVEIAYVDRPHLRRELVFVRLEGDRVVELSRQAGLTNHRIGEDYIRSGLRDCGAGAEVILANSDWTRLMAATPNSQRDLGPFTAASFKAALACK
jgi:hypothetical protein